MDDKTQHALATRYLKELRIFGVSFTAIEKVILDMKAQMQREFEASEALAPLMARHLAEFRAQAKVPPPLPYKVGDHVVVKRTGREDTICMVMNHTDCAAGYKLKESGVYYWHNEIALKA